MSRYLIANILSVVCACFTAASAWVPDRKKGFQLQVAQCLVYAVASYFFGVYATIITVLLCALRNYLEANNRFPLKLCIPFCIVMTVLGLLFNNSGLTGIVPVAATVVYSFGCCLFKGLIITKVNILIDLALWMVYDIMIGDFPSLVMDGIGAAVAIAAIIRISRMKPDSHGGE